MLDGSGTLTGDAVGPRDTQGPRAQLRPVSVVAPSAPFDIAPEAPRGYAASAAHPWRIAVFALIVALAAIVGVFHETAWDIVEGWMRTGTFAHGFVIVPISLWLIWRLRGRLAGLLPVPQPLALIPLAMAGAAWLVAHSAGVHAPEQFAFVTMIPVAVWAILGTSVTKRIAFPLAFLFFAVPAGDFLMPTLMDHTADFTVAALRLSGVPVFREGNYFAIPSGNWSVVEACSGLRYLIASITLGCLFAYLNYRSFARRAAFVLASIAVPIIANWIRAYMIVMLAHVSSNKLATGVDHLVYGWLFFGIVMMALFWVGNFWRDDDVETPDTEAGPAAKSVASPAVNVTPAAPARRSNARRTGILTAAVVALILPWPALSAWLDAVADRSDPGAFAIEKVNGWVSGAPRFSTWTPHYLRARATTQETFAAGDRKVALFVAYYSGQLNHGALITYENQVVLVSDKVWGTLAQKQRVVDAGGRSIPLVESKIRGQVDAGTESLLVWKWYWINGRVTDNDYVAKALTAFDKLTGRGDDSAVVVVSTPLVPDHEADAQARLAAFVNAAGPVIAERLAGIRDQSRR